MADIIYTSSNPHRKNLNGSLDSQRSSDKLAPNGKSPLAEIKRLLEDSDPGITVTEFIPSTPVKKLTFH